MRKVCFICTFLFVFFYFSIPVAADEELLTDVVLPVIVLETDEPAVYLELEQLIVEGDNETVSKDPELSLEMLLQDDAFVTLCATIHFEAGEDNSLEAKYCVGRVILNRLNDVETWGYSSIHNNLLRKP